MELPACIDGSPHRLTTDWSKQFHFRLKESSPAEVNKDPWEWPAGQAHRTKAFLRAPEGTALCQALSSL